MTDPAPPLSEDEYVLHDYPSKNAAKLLLPCRSFAGRIAIFAGVALLAGYAMGRLDILKSQPETDAPALPKKQDRMIEQPSEPTEPPKPFKSLVMDAAQSYLITGRLPIPATAGRTR